MILGDPAIAAMPPAHGVSVPIEEMFRHPARRKLRSLPRAAAPTASLTRCRPAR
jgi:hypothetical protein